MAERILIVGGVAGGASAAARLRRLNENAEIILIERGPHISFANCGLPYYIGGAIKERGGLLVQTREGFKARFNIDVRINSKAITIDRDTKQLHIRDLAAGITYVETYDTLVLSPGAEPIRPSLPGIDSNRIFTLRNIPDMDAIHAFIETNKPKRVVVIGAGYIGLEMAENLHQRGLAVAIVEMMDQVMPLMDGEMAGFIHEHLEKHHVALWLGDAVAAFRQSPSGLVVTLKSGAELTCDFAMLAVGVKPEVTLAKEAGLEIGTTGGIKVSEYLRTSDPDIYAIGDAIEVKDFVLGTECLIPLAGPANKQGRIAADNICGRNVTYKGTQGTAILKVFDRTVAMTGATEKALRKAGIEYEKLYIHPANHAGYYPGATQIHLKLLLAKPQGRIVGAQIVGSAGVDKRIDVFATAISAGMTVFDLQQLELAYAPPFGSAKDPVNMAGYAAANMLDGTIEARHFDELGEGDYILDVRTAGEVARGALPGAVNIPVDELRGRLDDLPKDKTIHPYCGVGLRSYVACRILSQNGFAAKNLPGGYTTYRAREYARVSKANRGQELRDEFCRDPAQDS
ncbi:MAG: FAD-dependent oxidoreductase [Planctomycetota bacterium]|jgi:NADPH-dependent 2,4-dienoyl-CoA reductase/sulfur reductase-like enzyme/rhodanese-related sulfurtransferase